ncbi:MAG: hypothetical protein LBS55_01605 [Prevotellaceae bacterium]|nr:hypothetical protein [Prevotellaceae bacterium]
MFQSKYTSLYAKANLNPKWRVKTSSFTTRTDSVGIYTYISKLGVKGKGYSCGDSIEFSYRLTVVDTIAPKSKSITLCWEDIMGDRGKLPVNDHFGRTESGSYSPSIVNNKDVTALSDTANSSKINVLAGWTDRRHKFYTTYEFSYKECGGAINKVYDSIFWIVDIAEKAKNWGIDTAMYCRSAGTANIIDIWATVEGLRPSLSQNNSYWKEFGLNQTGTPLNYGTVHGGPALNGYTLKIDSLKSNINYYFQWRPDGGAKPCYLAKDHKTDSGLMLVIIRDGIAPIDFTAQLCLSSYTKGVKFNLNDYTSLDLTWTGNEVVDGHNINLDGLVQGTHKYSYKLAGACGYPNGVGVFYIKATNRVKVSSSKTVKYCVNRLPSKINLNDILNVAVAGVTWTLESVKNAGGTDVTIMTGGNIANVLNTTSGILDIAEFGRQYTTGPAVLKFKTGGSNGPGCGVPDGTMVTLEFNAVL